MESNKSIYRLDQQKTLYKALVDAYEIDKFILETYRDSVMIKRRRDDDHKDEEPSTGSNWGPREEELEKNQSHLVHLRKKPPSHLASLKKAKPPTPDHDWNKTLPAAHEAIQPWISNLARKDDSRDSFNELRDTPLDFSALVELEYFLKEVYKETTDQLDENNPEGQQYPHDLHKPLPLIPNSQGRHVIPFDYFINNDLAYLRGVQGKLTNLTIEKRLALNVSLRMFTRSIVIQRRVKDLQLGVESYQKKLNLTRSDTYRSDLKRLPTYSAYPNPKGFIYHNKDKKNRLMRINELHKFSDGTLNDVRTALDDILKRIRMKYLPLTFWRNVDKEIAGAMIQAIDKQLKNIRIMSSLEKFVGGRPYEGDFRLLQRTI
ncbi:hypothetical protein Tco_1321239 [Tanacetum coccineum]